jgi:hypothetical protein
VIRIEGTSERTGSRLAQTQLAALEALAQFGTSRLTLLLDESSISEWEVDIDNLDSVFAQQIIAGRATRVMKSAALAIVTDTMECELRTDEIQDAELRTWAEQIVDSRQQFVDEGKRTKAGQPRDESWVGDPDDGDDDDTARKNNAFYAWMTRRDYPTGLRAAYYYRAAVLVAAFK